MRPNKGDFVLRPLREVSFQRLQTHSLMARLTGWCPRAYPTERAAKDVMDCVPLESESAAAAREELVEAELPPRGRFRPAGTDDIASARSLRFRTHQFFYFFFIFSVILVSL